MKTFDGYKKQALTDVYALLAGGGHKPLSEFSMAHTHPYLPLSGGTITGNIILKGGTSPDMTYAGNVHPYIRFDNSDSSLNISLIFTDYDSYRRPAGIKLVGNQGSEWFEAANIYATTFYGALSGNATTATKLQTTRNLWGNSFNGTADISGTIKFNNVTSGLCEGILWTCGDNDFARIKAGATGSNAGYLEIATADDGNEPIYVRQYTGVFSTVVRTLTLLDSNGFSHFPSYINIGGNENNNSSPDRVWGSNSSDSYLRSYRTSALNVAYASNSDTVDGYHATTGRTFNGNINWSGNWNDAWSDGTNKHPWYGFDHRYPNTGAYSTTISDFFGMTIKTANILRLDFGTLLLNGTNIYNINVASATKLQTTRTIWGQSFNGTANIDNTLRIRQTTGNYCEGIRIQTADGAWSTIILGATADSGTNTNAWSIHRKADNNFAISRNSSDGINGLVMTSVGMGLGTTAPTHRLDVRGDTKITGSIRDLAIGGGIYWNPYVESTTDGSDAASITVVKSGVAGGTTLVLRLMNDANDTILFKTNGSARLYHNSYPILTTLNTYVSNNKGYINGTEITLVNNADMLDGYHLSTLVNKSGENLIIGTTHASTIGWKQNGWSGGISTYDENNGVYKMWSTNGWHTLYYTLDSQYASKSISFSFDIMFVSSESTEGPVDVYVDASNSYLGSANYRPSNSNSWEHKQGIATLGSTPYFGIMIRGTDNSGKSCFYRIKNLKVELGDLPTIWTPAHADITWDNLTGKPSTFTPSAHTHPYLPLSGGTMTGALNFKNGTWNLMGDDAYIGDCNVAGMIGVKGANASTPGFALYNNSGTLLGKLYASGGTLIWSGGTIQATTFNGNATTASKLGTSTVGATNVPIYLNGGTPTVVNLNSTANNLINNLTTGTSTPTDADYYVSQYVSGGTTTITYHRRPHSSLYAYIKGKAEGTWNISINGNAATATNADKVDGYHASSLWRSDGATWNPGANVSLNASANSQEWSFDIRRNGYTGCIWHVWDSALNSMLKVNADNGKVYAPYNFVGNLEGNASTANYANSADRANYLSGHGVSPNNSHPGYGARVFYSWNIGQVGNDTAGYSNGITIGSNPGDTAYGFQIVQNMWDDRTYTRRYNGGWQSWKTLAWTSDIPTKSSWNYDDVYSKLGHTHDNRYYTESEINSKLGAYLPLSGGTMTGNITYTGKGTSYIGNGENDAVNGVGGALNNLVISSWYGVSFTTSCSGQTYTNKNAVSINCREGYVYANTFVGAFRGNASTASKWKTARKITLTGSVTGSVSIDGSSNVTLTTTTNHTHNWTNIEGKPSTFTPSSHTHDDRYYTESEVNNLLSNKLNISNFNWTNLSGKLVAGNEFNIVNDGFNTSMWFNHSPINDRSKTASINGYHFGNGAGGYTSIKASGFIKNGSNGNYVLLGDGGHKAISDFATSRHTHTLTLASDTGANPIALVHGGKYKLTAGGSSIIFTLPTDNDTNPANYYWANIKVSATSSTTTSPTFSTCYTNSWFRSYGKTGWYNESYGGGIYMEDSNYVRTYNSKAFYVSNTGNHAIYTAGGFATARTSGSLFSSYYNSTWYTDTIYSHGNGNISISAPGGSLYLSYSRGNTYFGGDTYYINRSGYFNGSVNYAASAGNADTVDGEHSSAFAHIGAHNNLIASGNEFTFASSGQSGRVWFNYRTAGGLNGNITEYIFGNGKGGTLGTALHTGNYTSYCAPASHTHSYLPLAGGTMNANARISFNNNGNLYIGTEDNYGYVYFQDMASQSGTAYWFISQAGDASFKGTVTATTFSGALDGNADTATTASKLGSSSVGSGIQHFYLSSGKATASTATVGGTAKPMYLKSGVMTAIAVTVGSASKPVYLNGGTITACSSSLTDYLPLTGGQVTGDFYVQKTSDASIWARYYNKTAIRMVASSSATFIQCGNYSWTDNVPLYITGPGTKGGSTLYLKFSTVNASGSIYASHFYENSDIRYKRILKNLLINSNTIANLPLFDFEWIENNAVGTGTSALAVLLILPNIVSGTDKLTLDYGVLGTIAGITACRELVILKSELLQLKEKVKLLEDKLRKYENI